MKKIIAIACALALILALAACGANTAGNSYNSAAQTGSTAGNDAAAALDTQNSASGSTTGDTAANPADDANAVTAPDSGSSSSGASSASADTPSGAYTNYITVKDDAYNRISDKVDADDTGALALSVGMALLPVVMTDLELLPLTLVGLDSSAFSALSLLGMTGVDVKQDGGVYTITYTQSNGSSSDDDSAATASTVTQTCEYDAATNSMKSVVTTDGEETMYFEFVAAGNAYASQYYSQNSDGTYDLIKCFVNDTDTAAFGVETATAEPASIYKNTGLTEDFVKSETSYFMLDGDQLTVFDNGTVSTY